MKTLGWHPSRLTDLEVGVQEIRRLSSGQLVDFGDGVARLKGATGRMPPLFLAATGPRALQLAGQIADGRPNYGGGDPVFDLPGGPARGKRPRIGRTKS